MFLKSVFLFLLCLSTEKTFCRDLPEDHSYDTISSAHSTEESSSSEERKTDEKKTRTGSIKEKLHLSKKKETFEKPRGNVFFHIKDLHIPLNDVDSEYNRLKNSTYGSSKDRLDAAFKMYKILQYKTLLPELKFTQDSASNGSFTNFLFYTSIPGTIIGAAVLWNREYIFKNYCTLFSKVGFNTCSTVFTLVNLLCLNIATLNSSAASAAKKETENYEKERKAFEMDTLKKIQKEVEKGVPLSELESTYKNLVNKDILLVMKPAWRREKGV